MVNNIQLVILASYYKDLREGTLPLRKKFINPLLITKNEVFSRKYAKYSGNR